MKNTFKKFGVLILLIVSYSFVSAQGAAELELTSATTSAVKDQEFTVDIMLMNPAQENVISVRSWLTYDPVVLEAVSIDTEASPFDLAAPGENNISVGEGRVKIGRSNITGGVADLETKVASVTFKVLAANAVNTNIEFYDYQVSELGHTNVNIIDAGFPLNILSKQPEVFSIQLNEGVAPAPTAAPTPQPQPTPTPTPTPQPQPTPQPGPIGGGPVFEAGIVRPTDLRVNTGNGYVDLQWQAEFDANRVGFNIYYGKTSGAYTRRRTVSNANNYRLTELNNGETMYFAVTAYDQFNRESDYSNEVGVIINQPLSSTAPFASVIDSRLGTLPAQPQNGPLTYWLLFSSLGLASTMLLKPKKLSEIKIEN